MLEKKKAAEAALEVVHSIAWIRGKKVLLDSDLARLYRVETRTLVQAVKRHRSRFPADFMFQLEGREMKALRSQFVISKPGRGGRRHLPYVFTEQGVAMLSSVINSPRAILVNIEIMRAFVRLRNALSSNQRLERQVERLAGKVGSHDRAIIEILAAIRKLMAPPQPPARRGIGFVLT